MTGTDLLAIWREECERAPGLVDLAAGRDARGDFKSKGLRFDEAALIRIGEALEATVIDAFQSRVAPWMLECFGAEVSGDRTERAHRFLEEALELVQAAGCSASEAHQLVDYVFGRPVGELSQEVGGVMVTLAALCQAQDVDMHAAGETELARVWTKIDVIRAKHAAKPKHSPLPGATSSVDEIAERAAFVAEANRRGWLPGDFMLGAYAGWLAARISAPASVAKRGSLERTTARPPLPLMQEAFRTTETMGVPECSYRMIFDFPSLAALQAAEAECVSMARDIPPTAAVVEEPVAQMAVSGPMSMTAVMTAAGSRLSPGVYSLYVDPTASLAGSEPATDPAEVVGVEASPMGSVLQRVMARLADILDDDQFNNIAAIVEGAGHVPPQALPVAGGEAVAQIEIAPLGNTINSASWKMFKAGYELPPGVYPLYAGSPPTAREPLTDKQIEAEFWKREFPCVDTSHRSTVLSLYTQRNFFIKGWKSACGIVAAPTGVIVAEQITYQGIQDLANAFERSAAWLLKETLEGPARTHPLVGLADYQQAAVILRAAEQQFDRAHALETAGAELVACKDLKDEESRLRQRRDVAISRNREATAAVDAMRDDYNRRKPLAWAAMRALLPPGIPAGQAEAVHSVANYGTDLPFDGTDHRNVWARDAALTKGPDHV